MIAAMEWKRFFWKWVSGFAALGLLIPITLLIRPFLLDQPFGAWSVALMAKFADLFCAPRAMVFSNAGRRRALHTCTNHERADVFLFGRGSLARR